MTSTKCHITAKDSAYLNALLASKDHDEDYRELLRRKLGDATVVLDHAIAPRVATIDSRVEFSVGGGFTEHRVLTRGEMGATEGLALPITTMRGLALLGLGENDVFPLRKPNGIIEPIRLIRVAYQPEAARREDPAGTIVAFQPRWKKAIGAEDEDPGPGAA